MPHPSDNVALMLTPLCMWSNFIITAKQSYLIIHVKFQLISSTLGVHVFVSEFIFNFLDQLDLLKNQGGTLVESALKEITGEWTKGLSVFNLRVEWIKKKSVLSYFSCFSVTAWAGTELCQVLTSISTVPLNMLWLLWLRGYGKSSEKQTLTSELQWVSC